MVIGIDIGGTNIRGILWNGKKILRSFALPTPKTLKNFQKLILKLGSNTSPIKIGIGVAGRISGTKVISATNIKYLKNYNFSTLSGPTAKCVVDNDARCFAHAEYNIGAGKDSKRMLMVTLGTGVGRAYVKNGKVLKVKRFEYAEGWEKKYQKIKDKNKLAKFLSEKLAPIIYALDPEIVVLGGGVTDKKGYFEAIKKQLQLSSSEAKYELKRSKLGKFAGAIGAAMLWK